MRTLANQVGLEFVDLSDRVVDPSVASLVSESLARRYQAIPVAFEDGRLLVAMADPSNVFAVDDIKATTGQEVRTVVATASQIIEAIDRAVAAVHELTMVAGVTPAPVPFDAIDGEPVRLVFLIVGPEASAGLHVKILSRIARLVRRDTVRQQLLEATTADEFYNVLLDAEAH